MAARMSIMIFIQTSYAFGKVRSFISTAQINRSVRTVKAPVSWNLRKL